MIEINKIFAEYTKNAYPYLKIRSAVYSRTTQSIKVQILESTEYEGFSETDRKNVLMCLKDILKQVKGLR
jgi:hypothetical protein